jgi:Mitochondrial carrier protein
MLAYTAVFKYSHYTVGDTFLCCCSAHSVSSVTQQVYARSGLLGFYSGAHYAALESAIEKSAYFFSYSWLRRLALSAGLSSISTPADLALGYIAEASHLPLTLPIEVVLARVMTARSSTSAYAVVQSILSAQGWKGLYHGASTYYVLCLKPAIQYTVFNQLKALVLAYRSTKAQTAVRALTAAEAFVLGAVARVVATVAVFPFLRVKVLMQTAKQPSSSAAKAVVVVSPERSRTSAAGTAAASPPAAAVDTAAAADSSSDASAESNDSSSSSSGSASEAESSDSQHTTATTNNSSSTVSNRSASSNSTLAAVVAIAKSEGPAALFRGLGPELARGVLSAALMLMVKERAGAGALRVVRAAARTTTR